MAQTLSSPGVSIEVEDDSLYAAAGTGTIPLIFVATAANKKSTGGTGIAPGTLASDKNYGKVRKLTSPKELTDTFGVPIFKTDATNTPKHGNEQNEYGLQAAYSYLQKGSAYVVRADVDLGQLEGSAAIPVGKPANNTFWLDTASTNWGIFTWDSDPAETVNGQMFSKIEPMVITDPAKIDEMGKPRGGLGSTGTYAVVAVSNLITYFYKSRRNSSWVEVGSPEWISAIPVVETTISGFTMPALSATDDAVRIITNEYSYNPVTKVHTFTAVKTYDITGFTDLETLAIKINTAAGNDGVHAVYTSNYRLQIFSEKYDLDFNGTNAATAATIGLTIGMYKAPQLTISDNLDIPMYKRKDNTDTVNGHPTGSLWIKTSVTNGGADWNVNRYDTDLESWVTSTAPLYATHDAAIKDFDAETGGLDIPGNTVYVKYNTSELTPPHANFKLYRRVGTTKTEIVSTKITSALFPPGTYNFELYESVPGSPNPVHKSVQLSIPSFGTNDTESDKIKLILDTLETEINKDIADTNVIATQMDGNRLVISHIRGGELHFVDDATGTIGKLFNTLTTPNFYQHPNGYPKDYLASMWSEFATGTKTSSFITPSPVASVGESEDGLLWFDTKFEEVDIMVSDGQGNWIAYRNFDHGAGRGATNKKGPLISATEPETQNDAANSPLVEGDIWIDTSDMENYPVIKKYANFSKKWITIDKSDQVTEHGIVFADARWSTSGSAVQPGLITAMLGGTESEYPIEVLNAANFLDFDAPSAALYPKGCLLWNLRRSGWNVKKYHKKYVDVKSHNIRYDAEAMTMYNPNRWVTTSGNNEDGSGTFGRHAQRKVVVQALQALINSNTEIRNEDTLLFNLMACPGYPEAVGEMVTLNNARGLTAFIIGDTPLRLLPDATSLSNWGNNIAGAAEDNDEGLTTADPYVAFFYPWGYSSDNIGNNIVVPPSHMMLMTFALSDAASFPWFAPAGTQRGPIKNASNVGYLDSKGEFHTVALNTGQRDTLASIKVNPIVNFTGSGIMNFGQYTRSPYTSSLDRINVARLVVALRKRLALLSKGYLFQPNDDATRKQIKHAAESLLLELMGQRAIYDYLVVCDTSNNTPDRIDRSELYLDIAIEPTKAVEFIYIPLRLKNTGEIKTMSK